jgi:serine/threonine protein kinase/TPR repeat protein
MRHAAPILSIPIKRDSNRSRTVNCEYDPNWTSSYLRQQAFRLLGIDPLSPIEIHLEDSSGNKVYLSPDEPLASQNIPPNMTVIVEDSVGLPSNAGQIGDLRLNPDDYEFKTWLGHGSYGEVWSGIHKVTGKTVALKKLYRAQKEVTLELHRELLIAHTLSNPSILSVYGYLPACPATSNYITIVSRLMVNGSLRSAIDKSQSKGLSWTHTIRLPPSQWANMTTKLKILMGIASGMVFMHDRNIIHRDLKPDNILLDEYGDPRIADFGSAKAIATSEGIVNSHNQGTPLYQAPESLRGEIVGDKADVYSFGIMIYDILTGMLPFSDTETAYTLGKKISEGVRPDFPSETPRFIAELAESCWAPKPGNRPTSREVLRVLCGRKFLESIPDLDPTVLRVLCGRKFLESIPGFDLTVLRDFARRRVPPEFCGFLLSEYNRRGDELLIARARQFSSNQAEDDEQFTIDCLLRRERPLDMDRIDCRKYAVREAAELGDPIAMCELAWSLWEAKPKTDGLKALQLMKQAADRGCGRAGTYYSRMIAEGSGVGDASVEIEKYRSWEDTQNLCQKLFHFATARHRGNGVDKDIQEAIRLYELAADCGHSESCFALSEIYRTGEDEIAANPARAILYARRNYERDLHREQQDDERDFLGLLSFAAFQSSGFDTIPNDEEQSRKLLEIAHRKCFAFQQYRDAQRLKAGRGVPKDGQKSDAYFSLAASNGFPAPPLLSIPIKRDSNRARSVDCAYELHWTGSFLRQQPFHLLGINPSSPLEVHFEDSTGKHFDLYILMKCLSVTIFRPTR